MLTVSEKNTLKAIINKCGQKQTCLASKQDILCRMPPRSGVSEKKLDKIIEGLEVDGYIDVILSDRHGEIVYCITLLARAKGYKRESVQSVRYVVYRVVLAVVSAFITFAVGRVLLRIIT